MRLPLKRLTFAVILASCLGAMHISSPFTTRDIRSTSMEPTIARGALVITVPQSRYRPGDIVTFHVNGHAVTHRVMYISPNGELTTKGDANRHNDLWQVQPHIDDIEGKVVLSVPYAGHLLNPTFWDKKALLAAQALMCLLLAFLARRYYLRNVYGGKHRRARRRRQHLRAAPL